MPRRRSPSLIRLPIAVAASAVVMALLVAGKVPATSAGITYGSVGALAVTAVILAARDRRELVTALGAVAVGIVVGIPLIQDTCAPVGIYVGPIAGFLTPRLGSAIARRRRGREFQSGRDPGIMFPKVEVSELARAEPFR